MRGVERKNPIPTWQTTQHRFPAPHNAFVENFSGSTTRIHVLDRVGSIYVQACCW